MKIENKKAIIRFLKGFVIINIFLKLFDYVFLIPFVINLNVVQFDVNSGALGIVFGFKIVLFFYLCNKYFAPLYNPYTDTTLNRVYPVKINRLTNNNNLS